MDTFWINLIVNIISTLLGAIVGENMTDIRLLNHI